MSVIGPVQSHCHAVSPIGKKSLKWERFVVKVGFEPGVKEWRSDGWWERGWWERWVDKWMRRWIETRLVRLTKWIWKLYSGRRGWYDSIADGFTLMLSCSRCWRHNVLDLPFPASIRSSVSSPVTKLQTRHFENEWTDSDANWHKWSARQGHETINFGVRTSKVKVTRRRRSQKLILADISTNLNQTRQVRITVTANCVSRQFGQ